MMEMTMKNMKLFLLLLVAGVWGWAQPNPVSTAPDCVFYFNLLQSNGATQSFPGGSGYTNLPAPGATPGTGGVCTTWELSYASYGVATSLTVEFQSANAMTNQTTAGTFGAYAGTTTVGSNPTTTLTGGQAVFSNGAVATPFVRIQVRDFVTVGARVWGVIYGYKAGYSGGGAIPGTGCVGTAATPCVVDGPAADGAASTKPPVLTAGWDGSLVHTTIFCPNQAAIATAAAGNTQIVALSGTTNIAICKVDLSNASGVSIKFTSGTGANCVTGTADLTGVFQNVLTAGLFDNVNPLRGGAGKAICINLASAIDVEGVVFYAYIP